MIEKYSISGGNHFNGFRNDCERVTRMRIPNFPANSEPSPQTDESVPCVNIAWFGKRILIIKSLIEISRCVIKSVSGGNHFNGFRNDGGRITEMHIPNFPANSEPSSQTPNHSRKPMNRFPA